MGDYDIINLAKVRPLLTLLHRGSVNSPHTDRVQC